ncbi:uncharacterized protein BCR38DRAFT_333251 [Pseudomassariella vexata]|uniref:DUF1996 domain-containing protein n=1 Tax=Pseudomassariella vexata TaxID=1141098 RepID=A0A1Y2EEQ2_9PEZI|nr:uncharacterized protein BCR38DRAFT_333251 [Pseudomassariella vexata]ORY70058.1 hypothetical protein BCR38DRAFT_333251 [Pseudomassariella vexata]
MRASTASILASLATVATAKDEGTFAVLRFNGKFLTEGQVDPIVSPGTASTHLHGIMGGSNFGTTIQGDQLLDSECTNAKIKNDKSNYWIPEVFFQDSNNGSFTKVPMMYMNVYYFFEATDDKIEAFPPGLKIVSGDAMTRDPPAFGGGQNLDPDAGPIQPIQWICPRKQYEPPSYPVGSDGSTAGIQDPNDKGAGAGFPLYPCDQLYSPLRQDIHFPSCYNPEAGLDDYKNNMAYPSSASGGKKNCPDGWVHVPHIFFEVYWETTQFDTLWEPDGQTQPFVLSNGDATGFSSHGDFVSGWDKDTLQTIIDTCDAGTLGMDTCPQIPGGLSEDMDCTIPSPIVNTLSIAGVLQALPGNNHVTGWGYGGMASGTDSDNTDSSGGYNASDLGSSATEPSATGYAGTSTADGVDPTPSSSATKTSINVVGGEKAAATSVPSAASVSAPTTSPKPTPTPTTLISKPSGYGYSIADGAASQPSSPGESVPSDRGHGADYTVWDYITVTRTTTEWSVPTDAAAKRHVHDHMARHRRSGRFERR